MSLKVTADLIKILRERTGGGLLECKKALEENNADVDQAADHLRKKGLVKADKKADRVAAEGAIALRINDAANMAILVEINCETDFVARDNNFTNFVKQVADAAIRQSATTLEEVLTLSLDGGDTIEDNRRHLVAKIGENIQIRRYQRLNSTQQLAGYLHGTKIAAIVEYTGGDATVAKDIAMQVVASEPVVVLPEQFPADLLAKEKEIFLAQAMSSGKPAEIAEKMIGGKVKKYLEEMSLIHQTFIKNPEQTIGQLMQQHQMTVPRFVRWKVGEGIEKKAYDFAAEVMAQVKGG